MSEVMILPRCPDLGSGESEPRKILSIVIEKKIPAIMSYLSLAPAACEVQANGRWHIAKVLPTNLGASRFDVEVCPRREPRPLNIRPEQPVGVSMKYEYGKFVFETTVVGLEPSLGSAGSGGGGVVALAVPDRIEIIQRRSYFRVGVPWSLKVNVVLWHRCQGTDARTCGNASAGDSRCPPDRYWQGRLVDISAGGAAVGIDSARKPDFKKGQFVGMRFTPMPYETPLMFNAQIRNILPTVDGSGICVGLQIVGLEASLEGRGVLKRLCGVVEQYYRIGRYGAKHRELKT